MTVLDIVLHPQPILKKVAAEVCEFDEALLALSQNMHDTMKNAKGIGLAAPQVGISKKIMLVDITEMDADEDLADPDDPEEGAEFFVNPKIIEGTGSLIYEEGCLSIPGVTADVERYEEILVEYQDLKGNNKQSKARGLRGVVIQHETDHLNGILFIDHLSPLKKNMLINRYNKLLKELSDD